MTTPKRIEKCVAALNEEWCQHCGSLRDRHARSLIGRGAAGTMVKQDGRKRTGASRFPEICRQAEFPTCKLDDLRRHRLHRLTESGQ